MRCECGMSVGSEVWGGVGGVHPYLYMCVYQNFKQLTTPLGQNVLLLSNCHQLCIAQQVEFCYQCQRNCEPLHHRVLHVCACLCLPELPSPPV